MSRISIEPQGPVTITSLAGAVPFTMNLEAFVNTISPGPEEAYAITVHLTGYGTDQNTGRGVVQGLGPIPQGVIILVPFPPMTFPMPKPSKPGRTESYNLIKVHMTFGEATQPISIPDTIGVMVDESLQVTVVDTQITSAIMIGARNIIITDPSIPECHPAKNPYAVSHQFSWSSVE